MHQLTLTQIEDHLRTLSPEQFTLFLQRITDDAFLDDCVPEDADEKN